MNKLFTENLPWKIASLIFAFVLWVFVINTQNPNQPQEISNIPVKIEGISDLRQLGYELKNIDDILGQNFKIVVNGPRLETDKLLNRPQLITVTLNLLDYIGDLKEDSISDTANYHVAISGELYNVVVKEKKPQQTKVIIDKVADKEQRIVADIAKEITEKYTLIGDGKPIIRPEKVKITGAKSDVVRVSEAKVFITAKDFSASELIGELKVHLFDADGKKIENLDVTPSTVQVKLPIGSQKKVPVKVRFKGEMPEGYSLVNTIVSPSEVTIIGKEEVLKDIHEIQLEQIDKSLLNKTDLRQVPMILPKGVMTLVENEVNVSLEVLQELSLAYNIPTSSLDLIVKGLGSNYSYEVLNSTVQITLRALPNILLKYSEEDIKKELKAVLDLTGYQEGEYKLPITLTVPEGTKLMDKDIKLDVRIKKIELGDSVQPDKVPDKPQEDELPEDNNTSQNGESSENNEGTGENELPEENDSAHTNENDIVH